MDKLYYSISETANILGENVSLVRYWSNVFSKLLKPSRTGKGNRQYTEEDIATLKEIHVLVKGEGLSLEGAQKRLLEDRRKVSSKVRALDSLKEIRAQLVEIRETL